jgi:membrane associated rhomboid family serine protease
MRRLGSTPLAFPDFRGVTRSLVLVNLFCYFALLVILSFSSFAGSDLLLRPAALANGAWWQPVTYSLVHTTLSSTLFELLSLWFLLGFLENLHASRWVFGLYAASVLGTAAAALALYKLTSLFPGLVTNAPLWGCFGGIFGLMTAIGVAHGDTEFLFFFTINMKARYMAVIYCLVTLAMLFTQQRLYAFAQLGGALAGYLFVRLAPRHGLSFHLSERWYGLINNYYRWKRRRAGRKFEVYMRSQGKNIHLDGYGRPVDPADEDPRDRSRWN